MKSNDKKVPCPYCGEEISVNAKACPHCGSDDRTGWSDDTYMDGIDLPFSDEEYDETLNKEFATPKKKKNSIGIVPIIGALLLLAFLLTFILR